MVYAYQLNGYLLEELLAFFVKNSGYSLLIDSSQDQENLINRRGNLYVRGRGGEHQADVLGQVSWNPAFTYPIRLFVEAKFRSDDNIILDRIRNAIGILMDLNQKDNFRDFTDFHSELIKPRYNYVYTLFATSGFTDNAIRMALAHQIVLVDLSSPEYKDIKKSVEITTKLIKESRFGNEDKLVKKIRAILRKELDTSTVDPYILLNRLEINETDIMSLTDLVKPILDKAKDFGDLFVGMTQGPFILLLKADDSSQFIRFCRENPKHKISIGWSHSIDDGKTWEIRPINDRLRYCLTFNYQKY